MNKNWSYPLCSILKIYNLMKATCKNTYITQKCNILNEISLLQIEYLSKNRFPFFMLEFIMYCSSINSSINEEYTHKNAQNKHQ